MRPMSHADPQVSAPPAAAYQFKAQSATLQKPDAQGRRRFEAVFYSGDKITNHWFWGDLVFDISTTKAKPKVGCLLNHKSDQIVGSGEVSFGADMRISGLLSAKSEHAKFVADQADEDFPWEMSHYIEPGEIDQIKSGVKVSVNGREFVGPLTVFRSNSIREVSFCATGADSQTSATVFNKAPTGATTMPPNDKQPTIEELQASVTKLSADLATVTAANATQAKEIAIFRKVQLTELFAARGEKLTDESAAPFLSMSAEAFAATLAFAKPKKAASATPPNPKLFAAEDVGDDGDGTGAVKSSLVERTKQMHAVPKAA